MRKNKKDLKTLQIVLSVIFILTVSFFVIKGCVHKRPIGYEMPAREKVFPKTTKTTKKMIKKETSISNKPVMAIILDDWGNNYGLLQDAIDIQRPLTLAIIPKLASTRKIASEAHENGLGVMIHMPMEPKSHNQPLEPHTILTTSSEKDIKRYIDEAIVSVPFAEGMNNHMGSAATSNERVMRIVLNYLKSKKLFFVDSQVVSTTVCAPIAKDMGVPFTKRDVFIDNVNVVSAIKEQLLKAEKIALTRGGVVVIGHDRKLTLKVIKEMVPKFEKDGIKLVLAKNILESQT